VSAVIFQLRGEARSRWRSFLGLALLIGVLGAAVLTVLEGAHRTATVFDRFEAAYPSPDMIIPNAPDPTGKTTTFRPAQVRRLPQVRLMELTWPLPLTVHGQSAFGVAGQDPELGIRHLRLKIVSGRNLDPRKADDAILAYQSAKRLGLHLGDRFPLTPIPPVHALFARLHAHLPRTMRVVGIYVVPSEFPPSTVITDFHFTTALFKLLPPTPTPSIVLRFKRRSQDVPAVNAELTRMARPKAAVTSEPGPGAVSGRRSVQVQAAALWILATAIAMIAALILVQALARHLALEARDYGTLRTLGATRKQLWLLGLVRVAAIALAGALVALTLAYLLSPIWPIGTARLAEPHPGFSFDALVLLGGSGGIVVILALLAALPALRVARLAGASEEGPAPAPMSATKAARMRLPLAGLLGLRFALQRGRGPTSVPVGTTIGATTVAIAALAGALVFGSSLSKLLDTPRLYGITWNTALQSSHDLRARSRTLEADPAVEGLAFGVPSVRLQIKHQLVDAAAFDPPVRGDVGAPILAGRGPRSVNEIALGTRTMSKLGVHLGELLTVELPGGRRARMRLVGRAVIPPSIAVVIVEQSTNAQGFGEGALITYRTLSRLTPAAAPPATAFVAFRPGTDGRAATRSLVAALGNGTSELGFQTPSDLFNFGRIRNLPLIFAALVALLGGATLTHMLVSTVRRRSRDLAVLKVLGLRRSSVLQLVAWQSSALAVMSLLIGVPVGIAAGRIGWKFFAEQQGVVGDPHVSVVSLTVAIFAAFVVANIVALFPGRQAARTPPAVALRTE
jgi:ABC-type lipoprotein release transport system permease subunit